jgi:crotonobetainyl-CoA:carnitine CoA-transferase CaiB-like acyl-CoA transferase
MLGQHTEEVLAELGFETEQIGRLAADGIVGTPEQISKAKSR